MPEPTPEEIRRLQEVYGGWGAIPVAGGGRLSPQRMVDPNIARSLGLPSGLDPNVIRSLGLEYGGGAAAKGSSALRNILAGIASKIPKKTTAAAILGGGGIGAYNALKGGGSGNINPLTGSYYGGQQGIQPTMNRDSWEVREDYVPGAGGGPQETDPLAGLLELLGLGGGGATGRYDTPADTMNAETNRYQAESQRALYEAQIANYSAQQAAQEAEIALARGDRVLARQKFEDSQTWAARAADAQDRQNQISGYGAETGRINAQTGQYEAQTGRMAQQTARERSIADMYTNAYGATEQAALGRGGLQARGAENQSNLASIIGNIGAKQAELQAQLMSTPRNAISSLLMSRGQTPTAGGGYAPGNLLGFDPSMLTNAIQSATQSAGQVGQMPAPQFDLRAVLAGLGGASQSAQSMMPPQMLPAPPTDPSGFRVVGNRVGGTNTGYQSVLDRMISGGAPQTAIDSFRQSADEAGYSVGG